MVVPFVDLKAQLNSIRDEILEAMEGVMNKTAFAAGPFVKEFEDAFAQAHQTPFCVGVNSGTSALHCALMALDIGAGDEVIVPANTFFATPEAVSLTGAKPVFVDCDERFYTIDPQQVEKAITRKTKAIIPVHLYGQPAPLEEILQIARKHDLKVIEDCAQAHLSGYQGKPVGGFGTVGCFSFYPGKNLGAYGEGGAILTRDESLYTKMMALRDHGSMKKYHHDYIGHNYRMEGFQGAILNVKLKHLPTWTEQRQANAYQYRKFLADVADVVLPEENTQGTHVYHLFVIRSPERDRLMDFLRENEVFTGIHYPIPCHLQKAYRSLGHKRGDFAVAEKTAEEIVSLPMYAELREDQIARVAELLKQFFKNN
jgi:dTDP-4-amino-4,6-dideoxygalactose transaminase